MTTTSIPARSLQGRLALPGFTDTLFVIDGVTMSTFSSNSMPGKKKRYSFVFWTEGMEERVLTSLALFGMPVDEQDGMIIAIKELIGPVVVVCLWGAA